MEEDNRRGVADVLSCGLFVMRRKLWRKNRQTIVNWEYGMYSSVLVDFELVASNWLLARRNCSKLGIWDILSQTWCTLRGRRCRQKLWLK